MALNHFASQIKGDTPEQVLTSPNVASANANPQPSLGQSRLAKLEAQKVSKTAAKSATETETVSQESIQAATQAEANINPALKEIPLTWTDQQMLCALSAMQIRYGRAAEAIPYLMMIRKINPKNVECSRLLALAFMRLERWTEAEAMVEEYDYLQKANSGSPLDGIVLLYRSLVSFKTNKIADAKSWFGKFRSFNKVS